MAFPPTHTGLALAGFQVADAVACAIPLSFIKADLDRLGCSDGLQKALPFVKAASSLGLLVGRRSPRIGALASAGLVAYFVAAVGFHKRAGDKAVRALPASVLGAWSAISFLQFRALARD